MWKTRKLVKQIFNSYSFWVFPEEVLWLVAKSCTGSWVVNILLFTGFQASQVVQPSTAWPCARLLLPVGCCDTNKHVGCMVDMIYRSFKSFPYEYSYHIHSYPFLWVNIPLAHGSDTVLHLHLTDHGSHSEKVAWLHPKKFKSRNKGHAWEKQHGWASGGLVVSGLATGVYHGQLLKKKNCPASGFPVRLKGNIDNYERRTTIANVAFSVAIGSKM